MKINDYSIVCKNEELEWLESILIFDEVPYEVRPFTDNLVLVIYSCTESEHKDIIKYVELLFG